MIALTGNPLVTVYITNYNYGQYLIKAIESVLSQTYDYMELIIIDDGSDDGSRSIIEKYSPRANIFSVFQKNKGLNASNNVAFKMARGKYIMRLDADDFLAPQAVEIMTSELERNSDCALVFPDYYLVDKEEKVIEQVIRHNFENDVSLLDQPAHGACTLIRKSILESIGGYDQTFSIQDGYDLWLNIIDKYPVRNVNLPLFYYRQHDKSITSNEKKLLQTRGQIKAKHVQKRQLAPNNVIAIIPVRGHIIDSRSNPLKKVGDKCLIDWAIDSALRSRLVSKVLITSPDNQVINHVSNSYTEVMLHKRDVKLARINTAIEDTALEALHFYSSSNDEPDALLMLYIEAPFRSTRYIDKAINTFQLYDVDVVDGVRTDDDILYVHRGNGLEPWQKDRKLRLEREELYRRAGGIHLIRVSTLKETKNMLAGRIGHIFLDQQAAFTIKSDLDWEIADLIASKEDLIEDMEK
jgi:glycosyltransferase involved in cell wall biosynthesis|tara:strand:+ start:1776 stop:3176 length:1401 start_codon:yes stop_codon:yes gene_type:complete